MMYTESIVAINIPSKSEKRASELRDAVRLLAWDSYKLENNLKGKAAFEGYAVFNDEWKEHEIQEMNLAAIEKFIKSLGYTPEEMMILRSETYTKKAQMNSKSANSTSTERSEAPSFDEVPY
ncbi:hypothetical protein QUA08_13875 [Microcoleus sp. T3B2]|uniref:hypothetical protein n=1 Tax=Microcoleus sp. T3B2 TaxID=3055426 RepID=UPI002FD025D8